MTTLVVLSVVDIVLLIAGLAFYLYVVGSPAHPDRHQPRGVRRPRAQIVRNAEAIIPGVEHINRTGGVVAGALPLLYGMAEGIVVGRHVAAREPAERAPARPPPGGAGPGCTTASATPGRSRRATRSSATGTMQRDRRSAGGLG